MNVRQVIIENFAGDLEYHPRRAVLYLALAAGCLTFWYFSPDPAKFTLVRLVFALGALALIVKGVFLLRKSSEGLGLSDQELSELSDTANRKTLPSLPAQVAQILQDFGAGSLLLWPLLNLGEDIDKTWINPPRFRIFCVGAVLFFLGWMVRRLTSKSTP